ncbi:MAG: SDR family oxidoreductase [Verrucomicrobiia bacterium]
MKPLIWITGARGLIGNYIFQKIKSSYQQWQPFTLYRENLDLTNQSEVERFFLTNPPDAIIHCAALSRSEQCRKNPQLAFQINVAVTERLSKLAKSIPLIFLSSDLVFDGQTGNYSEEDKPNPINVYGKTKYLAEQIVLTNKLHTVVRTSLNYGFSLDGNRSFNEVMINQWLEGKTLQLFTDEYRSPIPSSILSECIVKILEKNLTGIFHICGTKKLSRYEIGLLIAKRLQIEDAKISPISVIDYTAEPRPLDTSLNCEKIQKTLNITLPEFSKWIEKQPLEPLEIMLKNKCNKNANI